MLRVLWQRKASLLVGGMQGSKQLYTPQIHKPFSFMAPSVPFSEESEEWALIKADT